MPWAGVGVKGSGAGREAEGDLCVWSRGMEGSGGWGNGVWVPVYRALEDLGLSSVGWETLWGLTRR